MNNKHQTIKKRLKVIGIILLIVGLICTAIGLISFFSSFGSGNFPQLFFFAILGLPLTGIGAGLTTFALKREISTYVIDETAPVINHAAKSVTPAIQTLFSTAKESVKCESEKVFCTCGKANDKGDKFCSECGNMLLLRCPACGEILDNDSQFCNHCGAKV